MLNSLYFFCNSTVIASTLFTTSYSKIIKGFLSHHNTQCQYNGDLRFHHGGVSRIEGRHDQPHLGPWELGQGSGMPHLTYLCHAHKLNRCETRDLRGLKNTLTPSRSGPGVSCAI